MGESGLDLSPAADETDKRKKMMIPILGAVFMNAGSDLGASVQYQAAGFVGLPPALCGAVAVSADARLAWDLDRLYGPSTAVWGSLGAGVGGHAVGAITHLGALPTAVSVLLTSLVWRRSRSCLGMF